MQKPLLVKRNEYVNEAIMGLKGYILRMTGGWSTMTYDIIVNGQTIVTFFDVGEAKEFCLANRLGTKISNFKLEEYSA